ncbi:hypothetical protein BDR07DRAFT_1488865 [Suillus spraguei]|nr:hypothetical protein BDR07DRAFT_1488865 [Suillus spraguei]
MPSYLPSLESQIMVLDSELAHQDAILVINMVIFSDVVLNSDMPIEIPCVFGSKMAYTLPHHHLPDPGQRPEGLSTGGYFYVHIWDFNKRVIARSQCINDANSPDLLICKPDQMPVCIGKDMFSNRAYAATICHTRFPTNGSRIFLEQDQFTVTWTDDDEISISVISPVQMEVGPCTE